MINVLFVFHFLFLTIEYSVQVCASECPPDADGDSDIDCMLSEWSNWSECSESCDDGVQVRQRMIKRPSQGRGRQCPDERKEMRACNLGDCTQYTQCMVSQGSVISVVVTSPLML